MTIGSSLMPSNLVSTTSPALPSPHFPSACSRLDRRGVHRPIFGRSLLFRRDAHARREKEQTDSYIECSHKFSSFLIGFERTLARSLSPGQVRSATVIVDLAVMSFPATLRRCRP